MRKKWLLNLFGKRVFIVLLLLLQILLIFLVLKSTSDAFVLVSRTLTALSVLAALYVVAQDTTSAYKVTWVFLILIAPVFGGALYLIIKTHLGTRKFIKAFGKNDRKSRENLISHNLLEIVRTSSPACLPQVKYLECTAGFPVYAKSSVEYFDIGERYFEALVRELESAQRYIFLEYYIISGGKMWDTVLSILMRKAKQGVDVRVIYDDVGCFLNLPKDYNKTLAKFGIKCHVFNKFRPILTSIQNNRDHRKILVIDGICAFTGGINLADEYINERIRFGHWKDTGVCIKGDAAWSFASMFLTMWQFVDKSIESYRLYYPTESLNIMSDGFMQPFSDSPLDHERVGEQAYIHMINKATDYVYICTPYLMIDDATMDALTLSAKSGIDVRIITPHIGDKWFVHYTTRTFYRELISCGVKIYEYTPGFMHSKVIVSDDNTAIVGTMNLDYRSMNLQFECGVALYNCAVIKDIAKDFVRTLERCEQIKITDYKASRVTTLLQEVLRLFAPLM